MFQMLWLKWLLCCHFGDGNSSGTGKKKKERKKKLILCLFSLRTSQFVVLNIPNTSVSTNDVTPLKQPLSVHDNDMHTTNYANEAMTSFSYFERLVGLPVATYITQTRIYTPVSTCCGI